MSVKHLHVDLCAGLGGWQQPFEESPQWRSVGVDVEPTDGADILGDVRQLPLKRCEPDLLTMSPPCTEFTRWMLPWCDEPEPDMSIVQACWGVVQYLEPKYYVIENSRGLAMYWKPERKRVGAYYLWGNFPTFDVEQSWDLKMQTSGEHPGERAKIPYALADALRRSVEWYL